MSFNRAVASAVSLAFSAPFAWAASVELRLHHVQATPW